MKNIETNLKEIPVCREDWKMLKQWQWNKSITEDQAHDLVVQGEKELSSIARNFKRYFPNLFEGPFHPKKFHFRHTNTERTRSSFRAFANSLFGKNAHKKIDAETPMNRPDFLLRAYANCPLWREQKKQLKLNSEIIKFEQSNVFLKLISDVNARLGFNGSLPLNKIMDVYDICRYEQAWQTNQASAWCSVITFSSISNLKSNFRFICSYSRHCKCVSSSTVKI